LLLKIFKLIFRKVVQIIIRKKILHIEISCCPKISVLEKYLKIKKISSCLHNHSSIIEEAGGWGWFAG